MYNILLAIVLAMGTPAIAASSPREDTGGLLEIKGNTVYLYYMPGANLRKIEARLSTRYLPLSPQYRDFILDSSCPVESRISARLQLLLMRVEDILGMKPDIPRIDLQVLHSRKDLQEKCFQFIRFRGNYKSFYVHNVHTVFSSEQDIIDSIVAHELGHAVIDHYFSVPPPNKVAELLAVYVDEHLERE